MFTFNSDALAQLFHETYHQAMSVRLVICSQEGLFLEFMNGLPGQLFYRKARIYALEYSGGSADPGVQVELKFGPISETYELTVDDPAFFSPITTSPDGRISRPSGEGCALFSFKEHPMTKPTKNRRTKKTESVDLYQKVTDRIVEALENGVAPWKKPWRTAGRCAAAGPLPVNALTGKPYSGVNVLLLWLAAEEKGYSTDRWVTYRQAQELGGQVRKGETSSEAIIFRPFEKQAEDASGIKLFDSDGKPLMESRAMIKPNFLFNVEQCDGLPDSVAAVPHESPVSEYPGTIDWPTEKRICEIVHMAGVKVEFRLQNRACYARHTDSILMPKAEQFFTHADYFSTLLHEVVHATGHESRLNREGITKPSKTFGDPVYAFEELIAEMGSAFLCAQLGVFGDVQHDSYIKSWLEVLKSDKKALFRACRHAREASEFLLQLDQSAAEAA